MLNYTKVKNCLKILIIMLILVMLPLSTVNAAEGDGSGNWFTNIMVSVKSFVGNLLGTSTQNYESDWEYRELNSEEIEIIGYHGSRNVISIPSEIEEKRVTSIAAGAFSKNTRIVSVSIPSSVTCIPVAAFKGCTSLVSVDLNNKIKNIYEEAFEGCTALIQINLQNVTDIGANAFKNCTSLTSVDISRITKIEIGTFCGCTALTQINLQNITDIGANAFENCRSLTSIELLGLGSTIYEKAFYGCTGLTSVKLHASYIQQEAFSGCTALRNLNICAEQIGKRAFAGCIALKNIEILDTKHIDEEAFIGCTGLTSINLPEVLVVNKGTFYGCTGLTSVNLPRVINIEKEVFSGCTSLINIELPTAQFIGERAFSDCPNLTSITIPKTVTNIGEGTFSGTTNTEKLVIYGYKGSYAETYANENNINFVAITEDPTPTPTPTSKPTETPPATNIVDYEIVKKGENKFIKGIASYTSWFDVRDKFSGYTSIFAKRLNGTDVNDGDKIGTGTKITANNTTYTVVVPGDVTGEGKLDANDIVQMINLVYGRTREDAIWNNGIREASLIASENWEEEERYTRAIDIVTLINRVYKPTVQ